MLSYFYVIIIKGLQFRGHAMFSELDRPLGGDTIEYAWLMELSCGNLCGKVSCHFFQRFFSQQISFSFKLVARKLQLKKLACQNLFFYYRAKYRYTFGCFIAPYLKKRIQGGYFF